jgi:hypothetical protein
MPRVDGHLQHFGLDFARPDERFDGVFQRLNPLPAHAGNIHDVCRGGASLSARRRRIEDNPDATCGLGSTGRGIV